MNDAQKIILMGKADELLAEAERVNETPTHIVRASALMGAEWMDEQLKHTDVHTDNTEVIANLQAEVERLKTEKAWMIEKMRQYLYTNWVGGNTYVFDLSEFIKSMWE